MSLYHEAAQILKSASEGSGSLKTLAFSQNTLKSDRKTLFALTTEASKWSEVLSEVIETSGVLRVEKQLTPTLALLLTHDLLLSRRGVALPATHGLHAAIARHKARLAAELTKARIRRRCVTIEALRDQLNRTSRTGVDDQDRIKHYHPRWIRINTILTTLDSQLTSTFADYERSSGLRLLATAGPDEKLLYIDEHIPNLIAVQASVDLTKTTAYREGKLILQDKASCFPAFLLDPRTTTGDVIDACAAPGNKTSHLAALLSETERTQERSQTRSKIMACERDPARSKILSGMVELAGADKMVTVRSSQDFMKLKPSSKDFANVSGLLLDPSCSGSGIVGRDEQTVTIHLPDPNEQASSSSRSKKRKRTTPKPQITVQDNAQPGEHEESESSIADDQNHLEKVRTRLTSLSGFQLRLLAHAMSFPSARRITYSTCSIYDEENEHVVIKALASDAAREGRWRIMRREEQVEGLRRWHRRGKQEAVIHMMQETGPACPQSVKQDIADACIRCTKDSEDGTMGFFVVGFVRDDDVRVTPNSHIGGSASRGEHGILDGESEEDEWNGFGDD